MQITRRAIPKNNFLLVVHPFYGPCQTTHESFFITSALVTGVVFVLIVLLPLEVFLAIVLLAVVVLDEQSLNVESHNVQRVLVSGVITNERQIDVDVLQVRKAAHIDTVRSHNSRFVLVQNSSPGNLSQAEVCQSTSDLV